MSRFQSLYARILNWNWYLIFALIPVTGLTLLASLAGSMVAPPSVVFVLILAVVWLIPYLFKRGRLPIQTLPILVFGLAALVSTALAFFVITPEYKDISYVRNILKGLITLSLGLITYLVIASFPKKQRQIENALQIINWAGFTILVWTALRTGYWYIFHGYPSWVTSIQRFFATGTLTTGRALGFTMEPSWLAHQLNMLFLPFWLAATIQKSSVHSNKVLGISFENVLLVGGIITMMLTLSRAGIAGFFLVIALLFILYNRRFVNWLEGKFHRKKNKSPKNQSERDDLRKYLITVILIVLYILVVVLVAILLTKLDPRMATLFNFNFQGQNPLLDYANNLKFGERVSYWVGGWNIFNSHPVVGVGAGLAGYYIPSSLPSYSWGLVEVRSIAYRSTMLFNIKSLWIRILAETGLVGFGIFLGWEFVIFLSASFLIKNGNILMKTIGWAGIFMLVGMILDGFSVDSFALPYIWATTGLVTAASALALASPRTSEAK
jgi:hypothetical protein